MFSSRKYAPLPTNAEGHRRKRAGGIAAWRRYIVIGALVSLVVIAGYTTLGRKDAAPPGDGFYDYDYGTDTGAPEPVAAEGGEDEDYVPPPSRPTKGSGGDLHDDTSSADATHGAAFEEVGHDSDVSQPPLDESADDIGPAGSAGDDKTHSMSFEEDPNPASSTYCTKPHGDKPLVQFALTIDAGSTGSRIHVYKFNNCGPSPRLEYEVFEQRRPGLSSYAGDPTAAAASLDELMAVGQKVVPESLWSCTPVEVKATAGLRMLGEKQADAILDEVRNRLETKYKFVLPKNGVEIMDGKDEGVYAWITANYLLGKIGEGVKSKDTLAVMDLGGGSTQIVFKPDFTDSKDAFREGDHKFKLTFGGQEHVLYQHSYLNYGLMRARSSVHNLVTFMWSLGQKDFKWASLNEDTVLGNPCIPRGRSRRVLLDAPDKPKANVTMEGTGAGYEGCKRTVELVMGKEALCKVEPCSFNGVYQPALIDHFPQGQFLALSYFTDRIQPLLPAKKKGSLTLKDLKSMAKDVCAGPTTWKKRWGNNAAAMEELEDKPEYCLDLTFMVGLLGLGYEIHDDRELLVEKQLNDVELGWALGAGLALVEKADLQCMV